MTVPEVTRRLATLLPYDPAPVGVSVLHLGPGAFHRAHQAAYTHDLIAETGGDYGICAVSLRSRTVCDALRRQGHAYTLAVLDRQVSYRVIGSIRECLFAPDDPEAVIGRLADPAVRTVTLTITEKGYTLGADGGLDLDHPGVGHDLAGPERPVTALGWLAAGLEARRRRSGRGLTLISCDNLPANGRKLRQALADFAGRRDPALAAWIARQCRFPCTMVDSITPASDGQLEGKVHDALGVRDACPVQREAFTQWVIEDLPGAALPPWERVGAVLSRDVEGFETAKLRVLNGMHSSLALLGLLLGLETVGQAVAHPALRAYLERMCREEILPGLGTVEGLDPAEYARSVLRRFENPAITHRLAQIAWDSSQKLPIRILPTLLDNGAAGRPSPRLALAVTAWMAMVRLYARRDLALTDPLAERLLEMGRAGAGVPEFLALREIFPLELARVPSFRAELEQYFDGLTRGPEGVLEVLNRLQKRSAS